MKGVELEGYALQESRVEGYERERLIWSGKFYSPEKNKDIQVWIHYNTKLDKPSDNYSYQVAEKNGLVLDVPFYGKRKALYWEGSEQDRWLFVKAGKHAYEFLYRESETGHREQISPMHPSVFRKIQIDSKTKEEILKELRGFQKHELYRFARAFLDAKDLLSTKKLLQISDLNFTSRPHRGEGKTIKPLLPQDQSFRIDLPFKEGEGVIWEVLLKERAQNFFPRAIKTEKPVPCVNCEVALKLPQYQGNEKWIIQKTDPNGKVKLEFEIDNVMKKTILLRDSEGGYQFTGHLYIRYGRDIEDYLDGKKKRIFADTPEELDIQKLRQMIRRDLDVAYNPDENLHGKGELSKEALVVLNNSFPDWGKLRYLPPVKDRTAGWIKENLKYIMQLMKEPFITEKTWRSSETDPYYWDFRMVTEVGQAVYLKQALTDGEKRLLREIADVFLNKVKNLPWPSAVAISKDTKVYEHKDESFTPHFYAVITLAKAYEIFHDVKFLEQAVKQIELAEKEFFKEPSSASLEDLIRLGQAYKVLSCYQTYGQHGRSFQKEYEKIVKLTITRHKDWREEQIKGNDIYAYLFNTELKLLHLLIPEFYFETDI